MKKVQFCAALLGAALVGVGSAQAAFIVGAHSSEKGNANFTSTGASFSSAESAAVGLIGTDSAFGGTAAAPDLDTFVFSYTPGVDADNTTFAAGEVLGSVTGFPGQGNLATGITGGGSGLYNVYFTAPATTNISGGPSTFTITQNGADIVVANVDLNNNDLFHVGTGPDTDPGPAFVGGANNAWFLLGTVQLTAGSTYTVTQVPTSNTFVSQRAHAVMWEAAVPEPSTFVLAGLGLVGAALAVRRRS